MASFPSTTPGQLIDETVLIGTSAPLADQNRSYAYDCIVRLLERIPGSSLPLPILLHHFTAALLDTSYPSPCISQPTTQALGFMMQVQLQLYTNAPICTRYNVSDDCLAAQISQQPSTTTHLSPGASPMRRAMVPPLTPVEQLPSDDPPRASAGMPGHSPHPRMTEFSKIVHCNVEWPSNFNPERVKLPWASRGERANCHQKYMAVDQ